MRTLRSSNAFTLLATAATAQVELSTSQRTRGANHQLVIKEGAFVLNTGPSTYAGFVRSGAECTFDQVPEPAWVPIFNNLQRFIGYRCKDGSDEF